MAFRVMCASWVPGTVTKSCLVPAVGGIPGRKTCLAGGADAGSHAPVRAAPAGAAARSTAPAARARRAGGPTAARGGGGPAAGRGAREGAAVAGAGGATETAPGVPNAHPVTTVPAQGGVVIQAGGSM